MASKKKKGKSRRKKFTTISIIGDIAPVGYAYTTISGNQLGEVLDRAISAMMDGNEDIAEIAMSEINQTLSNITANPVSIGIRTGIGVFGLKWLSKTVGRKKIFQVGRFKLTT